MNLFRTPPGPQLIQGTQISTAVNTLPIPIGYGTPRFAGNVIWLNGFNATPVPSQGAKGGGKGITAYNYNAWFIMALSEGPIAGSSLINLFNGSPTANQTIYSYTLITPFLIPNPIEGLGASKFIAGVAPTGSPVFLLKKNGTNIGTVAFSPGNVNGVITIGSTVTYNPGDTFSIVAPASPDATIANLSWTFIGSYGQPWIKYIDGTAYGFGFTYFTKSQTISNLIFIDGGFQQISPTGVVDLWPNEASPYRGTAYVLGENYRIDQSATIPQLQFVAPMFLTSTCPLNNSTIPLFTQTPPFATIQVAVGFADADPASCIFDILTNTIYGAGFPSALIDRSLFSTANAALPGTGDATYQTYCQAVGFGFSVALDSTESMSSILQRWCDLTNTAVVWTGTTLKFIPYGDTPVTSNPGWAANNPQNIPLKYYTPNTTPLFALNDDDFEQSREPTADPFLEVRKDIAEKYNTVRISFRDRTNAWNPNVSEAMDENAVELYGTRVDNLSEAKEFTISAYAAISAQLRLQRNIAIDRTYQFKLSWAYCILEPMDIVTLTDSNIGVNQQLARITSIEEDKNGILTVEAEILPLGSATAVLYPKQGSSPSNSFYTGAVASPVFTPFVFEPTVSLLAAQGQGVPTVQIGVTGGLSNTFDPNFGGALIYISLDNITYTLLGQANGPSRMGLLTGNLTSGSTTIPVDLSESAATLETVTAGQAGSPNYLTLCALTKSNYTQIEFFTYTTATLTSANHYNLTGLFRGLYGSSANSWSTGDLFLRIDPSTFEEPLPAQFIGQTIYLKFISVNVVGLIGDILADSVPYTYVPSGVGTPAKMLPISGSLMGSPTSSELIFSYSFAQSVTFPINFVGSTGHAGTTSTGTATFNVRKNGSNIGTMVWSAGVADATFTLASATSFVSGDVLTIVAPAAPDATLANLAWTFLATL